VLAILIFAETFIFAEAPSEVVGVSEAEPEEGVNEIATPESACVDLAVVISVLLGF
jgi:hypothetical protein